MEPQRRISYDRDWPISLRENATGVVLYQHDQVIMIRAQDVRDMALALAECVRQLVPCEAD